ncbi:hypothetical protein L873DRAFT_477155 [Choiromyces venosus 120613-1]|uniref:Uncharacterized protein n=1 Tax=Choiromyces venosus 120613-1 TaxID=1336337 RepID=A0A3N4IYT7_9PEZI|nr:hypothetical protein L873DRAFT_477155 [Choiromyces venosus 120613-1]
MRLHGINQYNDFFGTSKKDSSTGFTRPVRRVFEAILSKYQAQDARSVRNSIPALPQQPQPQRQKQSKPLQLAPAPKAKQSKPKSHHHHHRKSQKLVKIEVVEISPSPTNPRHKHAHSGKHPPKERKLESVKRTQSPPSLKVLNCVPKSAPLLALPAPPVKVLPTPEAKPFLPTCTTCTHTPCQSCKPAQMRKCCVCHRLSFLGEEICAKCYHLGNECVYCEEDFGAFVGCCQCAHESTGQSEGFNFGREVCWECDVLGCDGRCEAMSVVGGVRLE